MVQSTLDVIFTNSTTLSHQTVLPRLTTNADNDSVVVVVPQSKSNKTTTSNAVLDCPPIFESKPEVNNSIKAYIFLKQHAQMLHHKTTWGFPQ